MSGTRHDLLHVCGIRHLGTAHAPERSAGLTTLSTALLVRREVERDEEEEVGAKNEETREGGELLAGAGAVVGQPREVGGGEVGPRSKVNKTCSVQLAMVVLRTGNSEGTYQDQ